MRRFLFFCTFLFSWAISAQRRPAEAGVVSDNDLYVSTVSDKYYTAGFEFFYRFLNKASTDEVKRITDIRVGQYIFNPRTRQAADPARIDRPFAGYLFAEAGKGYFRERSVLKWYGQIGIVGPSAFAEQTQKGIHFLFGYKRVYGWEHQIQNTLAMQLGGSYARTLASAPRFDTHFQAETYAGTVLSGARIGFLSRISLWGDLKSLNRSNLYDGALSAESSAYTDHELYFYISPNFKYQLHDATIEGSLFHNESPVVFDVKPFLFSGEAGLKYRRNRWSVTYAFLYHTKEVRNSPNNMGHYYGSIVISKFLD